jgi:hypothetical protein
MSAIGVKADFLSVSSEALAAMPPIGRFPDILASD